MQVTRQGCIDHPRSKWNRRGQCQAIHKIRCKGHYRRRPRRPRPSPMQRASLAPLTYSYAHYDVTKESDVKYAVDFSVSEYGQLGIMLCNAGISPSFLHTSIFDIEKSHIEKIFDVNVCGAFLGAKHTARVMVPTKIGSIIFTASVTAVIGDKHLWRCRKAWDSSELHLSFFGSNPLMDSTMGSVVDRKQAAE
ncbi:hypothetical protein BUALT_Bualt09G0092400 [Buddleja alternifolia]|uniref:Uncharacterized protein n=1 Tax=Buddleja alternifolia TaxID=168488 RepID=A0AAV6X9Q2_9LAMI|nr:hypothetical protein BUALT_Bualt09G0092400 [Buddleja alternifolia]